MAAKQRRKIPKIERARRVTLEDVRARIGAIRAITASGDHEAAHGESEDLWRDVLHTIAGGCGSGGITIARELARLALETRSIDFKRW